VLAPSGRHSTLLDCGVGKAGPDSFAQAFSPVKATHNTIVIQLHVHMAKGACGLGEARNGKEFAQGLLIVAGVDVQGQHHVAVAFHGFSKLPVLGAAFRGFREQDVERNGAGAGLVESIDQGGMVLPGPGPAPQAIQVFFRR
jgi:hypothetical protein